MKTGSEAERAQGPSGDGRIPSPRSRRPDPHGALPSAVPPTPAFANPSYPTNPALPAQSLGEGPGPYRVLSRSAARGNTRALGFCPPRARNPVSAKGRAAVCGCGVRLQVRPGRASRRGYLGHRRELLPSSETAFPLGGRPSAAGERPDPGPGGSEGPPAPTGLAGSEQEVSG